MVYSTIKQLNNTLITKVSNKISNYLCECVFVNKIQL